MNKEDLALFLGMLSGDGHLCIRTKKEGYQNFSVEFCNTDIKIVKLFDELFYRLFNTKGNFHSRIRENRKEIFEFRKYSKDIFDCISSLGFLPKGFLSTVHFNTKVKYRLSIFQLCHQMSP